MPGPGEAALVAVVAARPRAAELIRSAWDAGDAVVVIDPAAPPAVVDGLLARVAPTHVADGEGRRPYDDGVPVAAGTAAVVLTSGTTGAPKGVELTMDGALALGHAWAETIGHASDDRWLVCLPLHHVGGLAILARATATGAPVTVHAAFEPHAVAAAPTRERVTLMSVVPTLLSRVLATGARLDGYRRILTGGAPVSSALQARAADAGAPVIDSYGQSETWGGCIADGIPIPGMHARLGLRDEIEVAGPVVMRGYRLDPAASRRAFTDDGWLRTGDVGAFDTEGRLRVVDRLRDIVITGGVNVSPVEVESVLAEHPGVRDVAVVGAPDAEWGERVVAHVVPRDPAAAPTLDELRSFARDRLTPPKLPRELVLVTAVPRSPTGKILRRELRAQRD